MELRDHIRSVPDFPKPGILFYDISTLLAHPAAWRAAIDQLVAAIAPWQPDRLIGIESRGFLLAAPLAYEMRLGFAMVRKRGKLPGEVVAHHYDLEYGTDTIEVQPDAVHPGERVVVLDDLLATGGTLAASVTLLRQIGAEVAGAACLIELTSLGGRSRIDIPLVSLVDYEG